MHIHTPTYQHLHTDSHTHTHTQTLTYTDSHAHTHIISKFHSTSILPKGISFGLIWFGAADHLPDMFWFGTN